MNQNSPRLLGAVLLLAISASAATPGIKTHLIGGTPGGITFKSTVFLDYSGADELVFRSGSAELRVAYQKVNTLEYGQSVSRRIAMAILISPIFLVSKTHKHFVTLGYTDTEGKQQAFVLRVDKGDIRSVLVGLEARTGRRVEYQDDEARKAGRG